MRHIIQEGKLMKHGQKMMMERRNLKRTSTLSIVVEKAQTNEYGRS